MRVLSSVFSLSLSLCIAFFDLKSTTGTIYTKQTNHGRFHSARLPTLNTKTGDRQKLINMISNNSSLSTIVDSTEIDVFAHHSTDVISQLILSVRPAHTAMVRIQFWSSIMCIECLFKSVVS